MCRRIQFSSLPIFCQFSRLMKQQIPVFGALSLEIIHCSPHICYAYRHCRCADAIVCVAFAAGATNQLPFLSFICTFRSSLSLRLSPHLDSSICSLLLWALMLGALIERGVHVCNSIRESSNDHQLDAIDRRSEPVH